MVPHPEGPGQPAAAPEWELVELARSKPGGLNYALQGVGSGGHIRSPFI